MLTKEAVKRTLSTLNPEEAMDVMSALLFSATVRKSKNQNGEIDINDRVKVKGLYIKAMNTFLGEMFDGNPSLDPSFSLESQYPDKNGGKVYNCLAAVQTAEQMVQYGVFMKNTKQTKWKNDMVFFKAVDVEKIQLLGNACMETLSEELQGFVPQLVDYYCTVVDSPVSGSFVNQMGRFDKLLSK